MSKIHGMYDMKGAISNQRNKLQEQGFAKAAKENQCRRNVELFKENEKCFLDCIRYNPCPICEKCMSKSSNLYVKCQVCEIPMCNHKLKDRTLMIRRHNFKISPTRRLIKNLKELERNEK